MNRKAQSASSAAAFIAIMTIAIILYVLFLPPDVRNELLGDNNLTSSINTSGAGNPAELLSQTIGRITYINTNEKDYDIPTVRIFSPTSAQIIKSVPGITIQYPLFDKDKSSFSLDFDIDTQLTKNIMLSFTVKEYSGPIYITLNGRQIFSGVISAANPAPIRLDPGYLTDKNTITFSVPSPGLAFWTVNKYSIENLQITGDVTDVKNAEAVQYFSISESEKANLDKITLYFDPVCTIADVGPLQIELNKRIIFNSVADCGTKSFAVLDNSYIMQGSNELRFSTDKGQYLLDTISVKVALTKPAFNTYFFDLSEDYFKTKEEAATCGVSDGICPIGCGDTQDEDCCFKHNSLWCALPTSNVNDRCVSYVDATDCGICPTGYFDSSGDAPSTCENKCGDNNDGKCLSSCPSPSRYYDKDCCFAANKDNFWCAEVPVTGISNKCTPSVSSSQCDLCPSGYENKDGSSPDSCSSTNFKFQDTTKALLDNYQVRFIVRFLDDTTRKRVDFNINGHEISVDTYNIEYTKVIDQYVQDGTNTIEIVPVEDVDIAYIKVDIRQVS
jgi:hypothetical protein